MKKKEFSIEPNPDFLQRKKVEEAIKNNDGYCCCVLEKTEDAKCICKSFQEQQHSGFCHCGRYYKILKTPKVCLCGSSKFKDKFYEVAKQLTLDGYNVSIPLLFVGEEIEKLNQVEKDYFNEIHKAKIADADLIYIINCNGYIGSTTREEINWALQLGKKIKFLEED